MEKKTSLFLIVSISIIVAIFFPNFSLAENFPINPNEIVGSGKIFELTNSDYINVTLSSSIKVSIFLRSTSGLISLNVSSDDDSAKFADLTLSGLVPNQGYYKYQDSYKKKSVFVSDEQGNYTWIQDLSTPHYIWFQEAPIVLNTKLKSFTAVQSISAEPAGPVFLPEQCQNYGVWDVNTSTCTLNQDINSNVEITDDGVILDCNNYKITNSPFGTGIFLGKRNEVIIKNCKVSTFTHGIYIWNSTNISVNNNDISNSDYGIILSRSNNSNIVNNNTISNGKFGSGIHLYYSYSNTVIGNNNGNFFQGIGLVNSFGNVVKNNNLTNNQKGMTIFISYDNKIYRNNFINNQQQFGSYNSSDNYFDNGYHDGGNYWSDYTGGDLNNDGIGDTPYIFDGGQDNYPFIAQDGWLIPPKPSKTPVLIVPGLLGTEMKKGDELLWADIPRMVNPLNSDSFMDPLLFNAEFNPIYLEVTASDVIRVKTLFGATVLNYSEGLINEFINQGYVENENLFTFPYDWRYGVTGKYNDGKTNPVLLAEKIQSILTQTGANEVDIIAHSMGGLITKKYVMDNPTNNNIGKAIFVGVPNTGAPKSVKVLLQGDNFGVLGLNDQKMKEISKNMPASYDLLPSQQYYNVKGSYIKTIDQTKCFEDYTIPCEVKDLNYRESNDFLSNQGYNSLGISEAESLHSQSFNNFDLRTAGVDLYAIDGCKSATLSKIISTKYSTLFGQQFSYDIRFAPGDGTVPLESATNLPINQSNKFYSLSGSHSKMLSADGTRQKIVNLISESSLNVPDNLITQDIDQCQLNGKAISVFSPVDIFATDQNGNKLGLAEDGSIVNEIPGATFEILGEHKFLYLPQDEGQIYSINMQGTGYGTYTIKSLDIINSQPGSTEIFKDLPVTVDLTGQINIDPIDNNTTLVVKQNLVDLPITINPIEIPDNYIDKTPPEVVIQFDPFIKGLKFMGTDNITENSMVMVYDKNNTVTLKDEAGNTTEINLKDKNRKKFMKAEIKELKYNGIPVDINKNLMNFSWIYDKKGNLKSLIQHVKSKKDYNILAIYDGKKTTFVGRDANGLIMKSYNGLKIIRVITDKGDFSWSY